MATRLQIHTDREDIYSKNNKQIFITKVILENFLSFQKDEVDFGKSKFVILVGPNWSGKTSVFQAIKFALGSNERDERYKKWSNFIRNGQNHAMVEIHIQNEEELIKVRRYVIRGHSPYFKIQRKGDKEFKKVSVQEIQKIISDLKINPDNQFAFVSQGKIDAIKNLKPSDLCLFLEEGIGLKNLRGEILQQKNNVLDLNNELQSLKSRRNTLNITLDLLNPKLERLKKKNELLGIKKNLNDELLWANRDNLEKEIANIKDIIRNVTQVLEGIKKKKEISDREINAYSNKISGKEHNINNLSKQVGELGYKKQHLVLEIQNWQKEKISAKQELDLLSQKINEIRKIIDNFERQKERIDDELKVIKRESKNVGLKIDKLISEQDLLIKKINQNKELFDEFNQINHSKQEKLVKIQANEKLILTYTDEINQLFQSFKDIEHKLEKNKWFLENPSKDLLVQLDKELKRVSLRLYELESEMKQLEISKLKKLNELKVLQASLRERRVILPSNISILKDEINKRGLKVKGPIIDYLKYGDKLSYAIESVLGEKLLYSFVAEDWDTLSLLKRLKEKYGAYCNIYLPKKIKIIPMTKISANGVLGYLAELIKIIDDDTDIKKVIYSKVKNCLVVTDYRSGRDLYRTLNFKGKCVTLKGEQIVSYKYVFETPYLKRLKGLLSAGTQKEQSMALESEIKSLNERISELKIDQGNLDTIQKDIFKKKDSFNDLLYNFNQKQRITSKKNQLYGEIHALEKNNSDIKIEIKDIENQIEVLKSQTEPEFFKWNDRIKEIPNELSVLNGEKKKWDLKLSEHSEIFKDVKDKLDRHLYEKDSMQKEYERKRDVFQKADKTAFNIYRQLENIELELETTENEISNLKGEILLLQNKRSELERKNIQITLNYEQQNIKLNTYNQDLESKNKDLDRVNSEIGPLISEELIKIRPIEEVKEDISKIDKELFKYYDVDDSILVEKDQIIASLKEISKNQKDLEKDIKAAIAAENKMEKTYYEKFSVVLENLQKKVNQKFEDSKIKSYCSLEIIGNIEDLGVDIRAATSKEQLKSFTALSGGQVSLISICLILSLQEIKPSPLCLLDEPGMFLDEKNSEVAYQLIKATLEQNPIQLFMFLPKSSSSLFLLADKLIGIARIGNNEISSVFKPRIIKKK
ncbi:MAG: AAA family ATPase [Promethearchaeota archaeon]|nr:MAG: AAA family ATPase [Candidatus Lokiarchaeota archaeon]